MHVETQRRTVSTTLWHARVCCDAECLDLSNTVSVDLASDGLDVDLYAGVECAGSLAATNRIFLHQSSTGTFLLRAVLGD